MTRAFLIVSMIILAALGFGCAGASGSSTRGDSRLSSQLVQLVQAEQEGKSASFAEGHGIVLINGSARVIVEAMPGQIEAAAKAAQSLGIIEGTYGDLIQLLVPVDRLTQLDGEPTVKFVRLPLLAVPGAKTGPVVP